VPTHGAHPRYNRFVRLAIAIRRSLRYRLAATLGSSICRLDSPHSPSTLANAAGQWCLNADNQAANTSVSVASRSRATRVPTALRMASGLSMPGSKVERIAPSGRPICTRSFQFESIADNDYSMTDLELDQERISRLLDQLGERLVGQWLLVGGALVSVWVEPRRVTEDIDLIGLTGAPDERLALMDAVFSLGLPVEAVNSAADFFVHRIPGWRDEIEVLRQYTNCVFYRPTSTLFILLKMGRLSEQDLLDCIAVIEKARVELLRFDERRIIVAIQTLPETEDENLIRRREELRKVFER
jgi:hypothetical protein